MRGIVLKININLYFLRWNIKIHTCRVDLLSEKADLGPLLEVILDNCHVESIPPPNLQSIERIKCSEPMYNYTCDPLRAHNMTFLGEDTNSTCDNATRGICLNPLPNKPLFFRVCSRNLLKTLWEKEKLLVMSNFSFYHNVFYPFGELSVIFIKNEVVSCKLFEFGILNMEESIICRLGKG